MGNVFHNEEICYSVQMEFSDWTAEKKMKWREKIEQRYCSSPAIAKEYALF